MARVAGPDHGTRDSRHAALHRRPHRCSTRDGTLPMPTNAGRFHHARCKLTHAHDAAIFGSSANLTLQGTHFGVADIEPEIRAIADVVIDYGHLKDAPLKCSSTLLDVATLAVHRKSNNFEAIV